MRIEKRSMGWIQKPSAYQYNQQLNARRRAMAQGHLQSQSLLSGAIFSAQDSFSQGITEITLKAVIAKVQASAKSKIDAGLAQIENTRKDLLGVTPTPSSSGSDVLDKSA
jgi:hypothetical protein